MHGSNVIRIDTSCIAWRSDGNVDNPITVHIAE